MPILRKFSAEFNNNNYKTEFLSTLPHYYYEENNLHAFLIEKINDFDTAITLTDAFLPFVDNWATCDMLRPKVFAKNKENREKLQRLAQLKAMQCYQWDIDKFREIFGKNYL